MKVTDEMIDSVSGEFLNWEETEKALQKIIDRIESRNRVDVLRVTRMISDKIGTTSNYMLLLHVQNELLQIARQELPDE